MLYVLSLPFKFCMTCMVNKAEDANIQNMMVSFSPNFTLQEKKWLNEEVDG